MVVKRVESIDDNQKAYLAEEIMISNTLPECESLHRFRGHSDLNQNGLIFRIYSDYMPRGDLQDLILHYYANGGPHLEEQVPEPFIWLVFLNLAEALYAFNTGECARDIEAAGRDLHERRNTRSRKQWTEQIHRDIKPRNIFLDQPREPYLAYPKPVLADFDLMVQAPTEEGMAAFKVGGDRIGGTPGYIAPVRYS